MTEQARCEPREGTPAGTWHWIEDNDGRAIACWTRKARWMDLGWWYLPDLAGHSPAQAADLGYHYIAPVPDPADIARLVAAATKVERELTDDYERRHNLYGESKAEDIGRLMALRTALAAFTAKET